MFNNDIFILIRNIELLCRRFLELIYDNYYDQKYNILDKEGSIEMKYKIYKNNCISQIFFAKTWYTLPCRRNIISRLYKKLEIKNACVVITNLSKEYLKRFQQDEKQEVKISTNLNSGYNVYVNPLKGCDISSIINNALESDPEDILILENSKALQLNEIIEQFEINSLEQLIQNRIILSVLVIRVYENEMFYLYDSERKTSINQYKYFAFKSKDCR